jgi:hypothetical protein
MCPAHLILLDLMILIILGDKNGYEVPHYAAFSNLLTLHPSSVQIFSSTPCSQISSVYAPLNVRDQNSHPHETTSKIIF